MLDTIEITKNPELFIENLKLRNVKNSEVFVTEIIKYNHIKKQYKTNLDKNNLEINKITNKIKSLDSKDKSKTIALKNEASDLKKKNKEIKAKYEEVSNKLVSILENLPNIPHTSVPLEEDEIIYQSDISKFKDNLIPHWDLVKKFNLIDFNRGSKISGTGFPIYKNKLVKLQRSLINFFLDSAIKEGYEELEVPLLVNQQSVYGTGQLPDKEGMMYKLSEDDLYLIPTAEVPVTNYHRNEILLKKELPKKYVSYSQNFRREAGSWGSNVRGLNRLHQFNKVEIVQIQVPELSYETLENMCGYVEKLLQQLSLPYRKLKLCIKELGFTSSMTYDLEVYSAGQKKWLEVSSISNFESFQSNRLNIRYKDKDNLNKKTHTLNGSAIALPRIISALLENNQNESQILIPEALIPYTGFEVIKYI